jgi:transcriptional antiterminator
MTFISIKQVSDQIGLSTRTLTYKIAMLKKKRLFKKQYKGRIYTVKEMQNVLDLLKISYKIQTAKPRKVKH